MPHPHPSTSSHLATETALLEVLHTRSKHQHRSQLFLQRLRGVLRLSKRVIAALPARDGPSTDPYRAVAPLLPKVSSPAYKLTQFTSTLLHAAGCSSAIIELNHFVPLHTTLLACYARLLSVTLALGAALGMSQTDLLLPSEKKVESRPAPVTREIGEVGEVITRGKGDLGEVIARPSLGEVIARPASSLPPSRSSVPTEPEPSPAPAPAKPKKRKSDDKGTDVLEAKPKKKAKDGMDDTFDTRPKKAKGGIDDIFGDRPKKAKIAGDGDKPKKVKAQGADGMNDIFGDKPKKNKAEAVGTVGVGDKPKKKAKGEMDDIFGADKPKKKTRVGEAGEVADSPAPSASPAPASSAKPKKPKSDKPKPAKKKRSTMDSIFGF
jgi:hypothetical protein